MGPSFGPVGGLRRFVSSSWYEVAFRDAFRIRRIYRKLVKSKGGGPLYRITVFVRLENVVMLLEFLGYCLE